MNRSIRVVASLAALAILFADPALAQRAETVRVVPGEHYAAGGIKRFLFGTSYRDLWTVEIEVEVLDLDRLGGGLEPVMRVGRLQTLGLALRGADGKSYTFRGVDKDPTAILPDELLDTAIADIAQDQISSGLPAAPIVANAIAQAAGILTLVPRLVVMPDDPRLGEFRADFAGVLGTIEEFPTAGNTFNATEIVSGRDVFDLLTADPGVQVDAREFLRARLIDLLVGDWDRHADQWRWARVPGKDALQPIPEDHDQAFSRYGGLAMQMARDREPKFDVFGPEYQGLEGLTWNARSIDRRLLTGLDKATWLEIAGEVRAAVTDAVIERAVGNLPDAFRALRGDELGGALRARRDNLVDQAQRFYEYLAREVNVYATNVAETVVIDRGPNGDVTVSISPGAGACAAPEAATHTFNRRFEATDTNDVRVYIGGGDDRVIVRGVEAGGIDVHIVGGAGTNQLCDTLRQRESTFDMSSSSDAGRGRKVAASLWLAPSEPIEETGTPEANQGAAAEARRDWGSTAYRMPWIGAGPDVGLFLGMGAATEKFGFRKRPFGAQHQVRAGFALGAARPRVDYRGEFRRENHDGYFVVQALASGIETLNFHGIGNDTAEIESADFRRAVRTAVGLEVRWATPLGPNMHLSAGPIVRYSTTDRDADDLRFVNVARPYGIENTAQVGVVGGFGFNNRRSAGVRDLKGSDDITRFGPSPVGPGYTFDVDAEYYPDMLDLRDSYTVVRSEGTASFWVGERGPGIAFRLGGVKTWGDVPYYDLAYIGSRQVRGLLPERFAGDSSIYANMLILARVGRLSLVVPGRWGIVTGVDVGRVWVAGENSDEWHWSVGGGLWWSPWNFANAFRVYAAQGDEGLRMYLLMGFGF